MTRKPRASALQRIRSNIEKFGHHIYIVTGGQIPRFAYTIGLSSRKGTEVLIAGASIYSNSDIKCIFDTLAANEKLRLVDQARTTILPHGDFILQRVDASWAGHLVLGAIDYYGKQDVPVLQVLPDTDHWTVDIPDFTRPRCVGSDPIWQWLVEPWPFAVPKSSTAITNISALRGATITEVMRWEDDGWEAFAGPGPEVRNEEMRIVPLGTLLGSDPSLLEITQLKKGSGLWRVSKESDWHAWG